MKLIFAYLLIILGVIGLTSCGYSSRGNEAVGQVKLVHNTTPMFCPDYIETSVSLGVTRNGVGSMSGQDLDFVVSNATDAQRLRQAAELGNLVKIRYSVRRFVFCTDAAAIITDIEPIVEPSSGDELHEGLLGLQSEGFPQETRAK